MKIIKSQNPNDIPKYNKNYWHAKASQERLEAVLALIQFTKTIYKANPHNPPLDTGR